MADLSEIKALIERALPGAEVEIVDETGTADHLRAAVSAPQFEGLSRINQHRLVKSAVQERMDDGSIHALSVKTTVAPPLQGDEALTSDADPDDQSETKESVSDG